MEQESPPAEPIEKSPDPAEFFAASPLGVGRNIAIVVAVLVVASLGYLFSRRETPAASGSQAPVSAAPFDAQVAAAEAVVKQQASPENYLNLSLAYSKARRFGESLDAAKQAIRLRPDYAEAFNNEAAAYEDLHQWDNAIAAAREALRLRPDFTLARNNLVYAASQKARRK